MKRIILLHLLVIYCHVGNSQIIKGTLLDKSNNSKVSFATVYLNGTSVGTYSDEEGYFELDITKYSSMPLTISALGYNSVLLTNFLRDKPLVVYLTPKVFEMEQVVIEAKSLEKERKENLKIFKKEFLGTSGNALRCVIVNEKDIRFNYGSSDDTLKAYASKPLIIYNNGLGYKITYYLDRFEYYKKSKSFLFNGSAFFSEDLATDLIQIKSFNKKRKYAYLGSRSHFFSSLWTNKLKSNDFIVENSAFEKLDYHDIVTRRDSSEKYLKYDGKLKILTEIPGRPITNIKTNNTLRIYYLSKTPIGFIEFLKDSIFIDGSGYFDGSGVRILGQMAKLRVGDKLPLDYKPELTQKGTSILIQPTKQEEIESQSGNLAYTLFPSNERSQKDGFIKGRLTEFNTNSPVCFADISSSNKTVVTKSNSNGEFLLYPNEFPSSLIISKFGYKAETIDFINPNDSLLISLTPLEIHKEKFIGKSSDEYGILLKKALGKFQKYEGSEYPDPSQKKLVYCRITTSVDSAINRIFESYAHINVNKYAIQQAPSDVARYGATNANIPGLSENTLDFKMYQFLNLPMFIERYITKRGFFEQNGARIALVEISLPETKNVYYINVADTSIIYFTNHSITGSRKKIQVSDTEWQFNRNNSTEVSFSRNVYSRNNYLLDWVAMKEDFRLKQKNKPDQFISQSTLFAVIPESSLINSAVKDLVNQETLTPVKQQINFNAKVSLSAKSTVFNSETNELLLKPYKHDFWVQNSYVTPDLIEQKHIQKWENENLFYSEDRLSTTNETNEVDSVVKVMNNNIVAVEKVYIETDRTNYVSGDTIWFSAFILENLNMDSTSLSRILHVDLINADNKLEKQLKLIIRNGHSSGNFALQKDLKNGIYRLRAYTQYMRNFQSEYIFEKNIPVRQSNFNKFIIVNPVINGDVHGDSVGLYLKTALPEEYKNENKQLEVFVKLNDTLSVKKLFKFQNDLNRSMVFFVPASLACSILDLRLTLSAKEVISEQRISLKLKSGISLQFFPESGKMIAGVQTVIAYKATDNESNPTGFDAEIVDENQNEVLQLKGNKSGVGKFTFTPRANHTYKAFVTLYGNKYFFNLPVTEPKGYILNFNSDSNIICIKNNQNINKSKHYLLVSVRGAVYTSIEIKLDTTTYRKLLPFETYPKGIVQITLFDSLYHPLAERLAFNNRPDQKMLIQVETDKENYRQREKVNLTISVTDTDGNPIESSLTMAVVDASKTDSLSNSASIESSVYLASELKGEINYMLFNLSDTTSSGNRKIDLVMMTQGWRNFLWNSIRYTNKMTELYPIEKGFVVKGTVFNYKKGRSGSDYKLNFIDLKSSYNTIAKIDENNRFKIDIPFFYNDHFLFIQNRNKKDKVDNLGLTLDTVPVPDISYRNNELPYISYKSGYIKTLNEKFTKIESIKESIDNTINIPEVTIRGKYHPWDTEADITVNLDTKDPTGEKYTSLFQMIYEEFGEKAFTAVGYGTYKRSFPPILIVNGAHLTEGSCPPCYDFEAYKWATIIPVNEISNVKFFEAGGEYSRFVTPPPPSVMDAIMPDIDLNLPGHDRLLTESLTSNRIFPSVVSFTTYSNSYRGNPKGTIVFPFHGIYQEMEFYKPDYENNLSKIPDNRTTIYWNPEIKTDSSGKANISFYNSDLKGKAIIRISGIGYYLNDVVSATSDYLSH